MQMQHSHTPEETSATYCKRHPETETNLRCGRCGDLICPRCMVTSPVGARCESCAQIGRPAILDASSSELGRAILAAAGTAVAGAFALAIFVRILVEFPAITQTIGIFVASVGIAGLGYAIGEATRYASGKKVDKRLRYVVAGAVFLGWVATATFLPLFNVSSGFLGNPIAIIGLVAAFYVANSKVRF